MEPHEAFLDELQLRSIPKAFLNRLRKKGWTVWLRRKEGKAIVRWRPLGKRRAEMERLRSERKEIFRLL